MCHSKKNLDTKATIENVCLGIIYKNIKQVAFVLNKYSTKTPFNQNIWNVTNYEKNRYILKFQMSVMLTCCSWNILQHTWNILQKNRCFPWTNYRNELEKRSCSWNFIISYLSLAGELFLFADIHHEKHCMYRLLNLMVENSSKSEQDFLSPAPGWTDSLGSQSLFSSACSYTDKWALSL